MESQLIAIAGGSFVMGTADRDSHPADGEDVLHRVELSDYEIGRFTVTNREFARFADDTGYLTDSEKFGWSFVFHGLLARPNEPELWVAQVPWWAKVDGSSWRHPEGPDTTIKGREDHPVVHVSHADAEAYCAWAGVRLPTEAEWEYAARGGLKGARYPWGNELEPGGKHRMNVWQGIFPKSNSMADGYYGTAPVTSFEPNGYGLYNTTGNVWEWCADWFDARYYRRSPPKNPRGPVEGTARVMRGGSFLCHASYCNRYRVAARTSNTPDSSSSNLGFRVARTP